MIEFIQSTYRVPWKGVILFREKRKGIGDLCRILVVKNRHGNWMRKPLIKYLDEHWTKPCESWITPEEPYNYSIPYSVVCARWRAGKLTLEARKYKKSLKRQWRGLE